jgi:hypothetical protein
VTPKNALLAVLIVVTAVFVALWSRASWRHLVIGLLTNFLDTLGIGSFATTTAMFRAPVNSREPASGRQQHAFDYRWSASGAEGRSLPGHSGARQRLHAPASAPRATRWFGPGRGHATSRCPGVGRRGA